MSDTSGPKGRYGRGKRFVMLAPARFATVLLLAGVLVSCAAAQIDMDGQPNVGAILQRHYDAAQNFQQQGNLAQAAAEYRLLIGDSLAELALGEANLGEYTKAAPYFDGALALEPNSSEILLFESKGDNTLSLARLRKGRSLACALWRRVLVIFFRPRRSVLLNQMDVAQEERF